MDIMLARILKFLNGYLQNDYMFRIGLFIVSHYVDMENYDLNRFMREGDFKKEEVLDFCAHLGYDNYDDFNQKLVSDYLVRAQQIRSRMLGMSAESFLDKLDDGYDKPALIKQLEVITDNIFEKKRIILIGALYPLSIAVEFQTDMISFGKDVVQYHHSIDNIEFNKNDIIIFISATGRALNNYLMDEKSASMKNSQIILITQNKAYKDNNDVGADQVLLVPGQIGGISFNYQIMTMFDIIRIYYYQKYYL
ncbi:MAG: MurR/RpiR family transcriptional regulator [Erysipelotrichaceae bacterium]|nr:MurR/RpiR family transcriptional regulator [Erysipelotrichaceae bacterium]